MSNLEALAMLRNKLVSCFQRSQGILQKLTHYVRHGIYVGHCSCFSLQVRATKSWPPFASPEEASSNLVGMQFAMLAIALRFYLPTYTCQVYMGVVLVPNVLVPSHTMLI